MAAKQGDWGGALAIAVSGLTTAYYDDQIKQSGGDAASAAALELLGAGLVVGLSGGSGVLFNLAAGVLGGSAASLIFGG